MRRSWPDLPGVAVWPWPAEAELNIRVDPPGMDHPHSDAAAIESEWRRMCAANPRLFDGPMLSITKLDPGCEIRVQRSSYKLLAVQPAVPTGVEQLSATAVVFGRNESGEECVLLGRRGAQTRIYGGMWELGPSGGVDPPPPNRTVLTERDFFNQLQREFAEETGYRTSLDAPRREAVCQDLDAGSCDMVFTCRSDETARLSWSDPASWEYDGFLWLRLAEVPAFDHEHGGKIIPPTRALFRYFGWI